MFLMIWPYTLRYYWLSAEIQTLLLAVCGAVSVKTVFKSEQKSTNCPSSAYHDSDRQTLLVAINMARYQHARQGRDMWIVNCEWAWAMLDEQCSMSTYFPTQSCNNHTQTQCGGAPCTWGFFLLFLIKPPNLAAQLSVLYANTIHVCTHVYTQLSL